MSDEMRMDSPFSGHFTMGRLWKITLPSIVMMVFTSIYGVTDGFLCPTLRERPPLPR